MGLFNKKKECEHDWKIKSISNAIQRDQDGFIVRLCIVQCKKCGVTEQKWLDMVDEIENSAKSTVLYEIKWYDITPPTKTSITFDTPKSCSKCLVSDNGAYCKLAGKYIGLNPIRPSWCPLEEVPIDE